MVETPILSSGDTWIGTLKRYNKFKQGGKKTNHSNLLMLDTMPTYFGLSSHALGNDTEFTVKEDATKAQIKSAFKKSLTAKKMNKKVLSQFMDFIA